MAPRSRYFELSLIAVFFSSGLACVREEQLDPPAFPDAKSTLLIFTQPEVATRIWGLESGPNDLPAVTVSEGLQIRAVFWDRTLGELEIAPGITGTVAAGIGRPIPKIANEKIFETNVTKTGATAWMETNDQTVHDLFIDLPRPAQCAAEHKGRSCRETVDGDVFCIAECPIDPPQSPLAPEPVLDPIAFDELRCPSGQWLDGPWTPRTMVIESESVRFCEPPSSPDPVACSNGQVQLPGELTCSPLGAACTGLFPPDGMTGNTIYVSENGTGNGSTQAAATATIAYAIMVANPGDTIAIAQGTYDERVVVDKAVRIVGACSERTRIRSAALTLTFAANATIADLTIEGRPAIRVSSNTGTREVGLYGVAIVSNGANSGALVVETGGLVRGSVVALSVGRPPITIAGGRVDLTSVLIDDTAFLTVRGPTATATITKLIARGTTSFSDTVRVEDGGQLTLRGAEVEGFPKEGIVVSGAGSRARLDDTALRGAFEITERNWGVIVRFGGRLTGDGVLIETAAKGGILVEGPGSSAELNHAHLLRNGNDGEPGVAVADLARATLNQVTVFENNGPGVRLCGSLLEDCDIDTGVNCMPVGSCAHARLYETIVIGREVPAVIAREFDVLVARGATLDAERVVFAKSGSGGVLVDPTATAVITDALVLGHRHLNVQFGIGLIDDGQLTLVRSKIIGTLAQPGLMLGGSSTRATLSHVHFGDNGKPEGGTKCGQLNAIVSGGAHADGDHLAFSGGGMVVENVQSSVSLTDVAVSIGDNAIGAPLCVRDSAIASVERLRAEGTSPITVVDATLNAHDVQLLEVFQGITLGFEESRGSNLAATKTHIRTVQAPGEVLFAAIGIEDFSRVTIEDLKLEGAAHRGIGVGAADLSLTRFDIGGSFIGMEIAEDASIDVSHGRIHDYNGCGIVVADAERVPGLYTLMLYDPDPSEQVRSVVTECKN